MDNWEWSVAGLFGESLKCQAEKLPKTDRLYAYKVNSEGRRQESTTAQCTPLGPSWRMENTGWV